MPDDLLTKPGAISVDMVCRAVQAVAFKTPARIEAPYFHCVYPRLCGKASCRFPRYYDGEAQGIVACTLLKLGLPVSLLKDLDTEYEVGEVLHPGVKIANSRNAALTRIDPKGMALLAWLQEQGKHRVHWHRLHLRAFTPRKGMKWTDKKKRPWLY